MMRRKRAVAFFGVGLPLAVGALVLVSYGGVTRQVQRDLDEQIARSKAAGMPQDLADFAVVPRPGEDANTDYEAASDQLKVQKTIADRAAKGDLAAIGRLEPVYEKIEQGSQRKYWWSGIDWTKSFGKPGKRVGVANQFADLLCARAERENRLEDIAACARMGRQLREEPILIYTLIADVTDGKALETLEAMVRAHPNDPAFRQRAKATFAAFAPPTDWARLIAAESLVMRQMYDAARQDGAPPETQGLRERLRYSNVALTGVEARLLEAHRAAYETVAKSPQDWRLADQGFGRADEILTREGSMVTGYLRDVAPRYRGRAKTSGDLEARRERVAKLLN